MEPDKAAAAAWPGAYSEFLRECCMLLLGPARYSSVEDLTMDRLPLGDAYCRLGTELLEPVEIVRRAVTVVVAVPVILAPMPGPTL